MSKIQSIDVPQTSLLARFGPPEAYRDCFVREVPGAVSLGDFVERFYCSPAFRPERILLGLASREWKAGDTEARAVATGQSNRFAAWTVMERREGEILLRDHRGATASWFSVRPKEKRTELLFGSWVGQPDRGIIKVLMPFHRWYSRVLLGGFAYGLTLIRILRPAMAQACHGHGSHFQAPHKAGRSARAASDPICPLSITATIEEPMVRHNARDSAARDVHSHPANARIRRWSCRSGSCTSVSKRW